MKLKKTIGPKWNQNNKCGDQIEIQKMTWHSSPNWLDTWHNTDVTCDKNNILKKLKLKIKKKKLTCDTYLKLLVSY